MRVALATQCPSMLIGFRGFLLFRGGVANGCKHLSRGLSCQPISSCRRALRVSAYGR